jgi:hypothetical protein
MADGAQRYPRGWRTPSQDFRAAESDFQTLPLYVDVDLTAARSIAAGTELRLEIAGNTLYVDQKANSGTAACVFQDDYGLGAAPIALYPGFVAERIPFKRLMIENPSQPGQVMRLIYGVDLQFWPAGVGAVQVQTVNGEIQKVLNGQGWISSITSNAAPGFFSHGQMWNPVGSGYRMIVTHCLMHSAPAGRPTVRRFTVALANLAGNPQNKLLGGTTGFPALTPFEIRHDNALAAQNGVVLSSMVVDGLRSVSLDFDEPLIVRPGHGVGIVGDVVNQLVSCAFGGSFEPHV